MLEGYLERRPATLSQEQVQAARERVAVALREYRAQSPRAARSTRPVYRRWLALKTRLLR
jgi:hypothetical protein